MSIYKQNKTDAKLENEGVWFDYRKNEDGSIQQFRIARMSMANVKYAAAIRRIQKKYKKMLQLDILPPETADKVSNEAFVETVLTDWRNITDEDGKPMPFNTANALKLITDLPDVYKVLETVANEAEAFRAGGLETDAKN
jgi:hypothetical protein